MVTVRLVCCIAAVGARPRVKVKRRLMRILTSATVCKSQTLKRTTVHGEGPHQFAGGPAWPAFTSATVTTTGAMAVRLDEGKAGSHLTSDDDEDYLPVGSLRLSAPLTIFTLIV